MERGDALVSGWLSSAMSATPQRTARLSESTPSSSTTRWAASPTTVYGGPARPSSSVLVHDSPRSRWTEHLEPTTIHEVEETPSKSRSGSRADLGLPPAAAESLARMQRSSLPAPFDLTDPRDEEDETVRPTVGRAATNRSVRIMQQPKQQFLQVPAQSYTQPESRGTTPMPIRPASQLGLITYGGRPKVPRFNAPGLDLKLTREPGLWPRIIWRVGLPLRLFGPIVVQLFLDFCAVYVVVQAAAEPTLGQLSSRRNWSLAAAAYCACVLVWIVGVVIMYEVVYCFWRRWRVKRPAIIPLYLSTPGRHLASLASYDVWCFFRYIQRAEIDTFYQDEYGREGAEGRAGNRSKDALSAYGTMASRELLTGASTAMDHRRSDSAGELLSDAVRVSGVDPSNSARNEGMRRRSVGRGAGTDVRESLSGIELRESPPESQHRRSLSGQTRFQELVHGPSHPKGHRRSASLGANGNGGRRSTSGHGHRRSLSGDAKSKTYTALVQHRRSASGRTSSEVERALDLTPLPSRRIVSGSSFGSSSVGFVLGCLGGLLSPSRGRDEKSELLQNAKQRLSEWFYARSQGFPTLVTVLPRAGIAAASLFAFWVPQVRGVLPSGRDGAFFRSDGSLTGFARGVLVVNVALALVRAVVVVWATLGLWILSGQACAGLCGPRFRWEEEGEEEERWDEKNGPFRPRDKLGWEWRTAARERVEDAYELCMVRRQSWPLEPVTPRQAHVQLQDQAQDKGKQRATTDTFGSTFGAGVVKERGSEQEMALSGLKEERGGHEEGEGGGERDLEVPAVAVTPPPVAYDVGAVRGGSGGNGSSKRGALGPDTFSAPTTTVAAAVPVTGLVPPTASSTPSAPVTLLPFPLQPQPLQSPLVTAIREREVKTSSTSRSDTRGTSASGSGPGTSASGSTPQGPSTSTLVPILTPRTGAARLESVSSRTGESVLEEEDLTGSYELGQAERSLHSADPSSLHSGDPAFRPPSMHSGDHSFTMSHSGDRSYDSYAEQFSVGDYAQSQESVRIHARPTGSEADTSGSIDHDTSGSLSSLGQPISSRFFPISFPPPRHSPAGSNNGSNGRRESSNLDSPLSHLESPRSRFESSRSHLESPRSRLESSRSHLESSRSHYESSRSHLESPRSGPRHRASVISQAHDSILSHGPDSIISHSHGSTASLAQDDSIVSHAQDSLISSPPRSVRSGLIPPPPPNPNQQRRRRAGTAPSIVSASSNESLGALRRRVESQTVRPIEFGIPREFGGDVEGFEAEREDSVGMLSAPSSRKNSLVAMSQRSRRGRVSSGSGSQSGSGSGGSRAVSGAYSGSASGSGGSVRRGSHSQHSEDEDRDHTFGIGPTMWRRGSTPLRQRHDSEPVPERAEPESPTRTVPPTPTQTTSALSSEPFPVSNPRQSTGTTSTFPDVSTAGDSFVTAPPSFLSGSTPTEQSGDAASEMTWHHDPEHDWER